MTTLAPTIEPTISGGIPPADLQPYFWLVVTGGFVCFAMAWGIGANDVANAFSTSIGSRAINIKQAVFIAAIFEFLGALLLGSKVTDTVRKKIVNYEEYEGSQDLLMLGMFTALCSASFWLAIASKYSLPVSTTHAIIGSIIGFAWVSRGFHSITWDSVGLIVLFWIVAPILCAICGVIFYLPVRTFILRRKDAYKCTLRTWPFFVFCVTFIMSFFVMIKTGSNKSSDKPTPINDWVTGNGPAGAGGFYIILGIAASIGVGMGIISYIIFIIPYSCPSKCCGITCKDGKSSLVERFVEKQIIEREKMHKEIELNTKNDNDVESPRSVDDPTNNIEETALKKSGNSESKTYKHISDKSTMSLSKNEESSSDNSNHGIIRKYTNALTYGINVDIHDGLSGLENTIHTQSEQFDFKVEKAFSWLQVLTAALDIFAHGSNDVANAIGPFAAMISLYNDPSLDKKVPVPTWILALGGLGMTVGLATYGYNIMKVLGVRMAAMSSTRGYCIELSSALVIIICSHHGLPASTTHAQVGSTLGIGMCELISNNKGTLTVKNIINWKLLAQVFLGWILTLVISALVCSGLYSFIAFSPCAN